MKTVILTGATGFVGANIARRLLLDGHHVHVLVRRKHKNWRIQSIRKDIQLHTCDFQDKDGLTLLFKQIKPDWIFHTAVYGAYSHQNDLNNCIETNVVGLAHLLEASLAVGFESFVNTGSSSEYGYKDHAPKEDEFVDPNSYYAVSKVAATQLCRFFANQNKVYIPTLRLYSAYGPYEEPTRLLPTLLRHGFQKTYPPLVDPNTARDYVYISDVVDAFIQAASKPGNDFGPVYNIGTEKQTPLRELVSIVKEYFNIPTDPVWGTMENRRWDTSCWVSTTSKIKKEIGWSARTTLVEGVRKMATWMEEDHDGKYLLDAKG